MSKARRLTMLEAAIKGRMTQVRSDAVERLKERLERLPPEQQQLVNQAIRDKLLARHQDAGGMTP